MAGPIIWGPNGTSTNLQASVKRKISTQTSNYTITENDDIILADSSSAAFVLSLPDVADVPEGKSYTIKKTNEDFNSIEIDPFNPSQIEGEASWFLYTIGETIEVVSDGTDWIVTNHVCDTQSRPWTPTGSLTTNVTYSGEYWRRGDRMFFEVTWTFSGTNTQGVVTINLPTGITIDTGKQSRPVAFNNANYGIATFTDSSATNYLGRVVKETNTSVRIVAHNDTSTEEQYGSVNTATNFPFTIANGDAFTCIFDIPVLSFRTL